ncbi:MAG TPA: hypothetical protein DDZ88_29315 [Verrucomicrobiales bacterium]|nr:hypothetical protein [Verrucomicrobiales bacterium]
MPVSTRQRADGFNKKCVESKWAAAWTELTALCTELPKETGEKPRQALRERLYLLAMNRAAGDLDESSQASVWTDLDNAEQALFPELSQAAKLPDEVLVAFLRVAHMRKVRPVLDKGMNSGKPVPSVSRKELSELGNEVRELQQRNEELSKDSRQRLDLVDAAVHLALVWTMTSTNLDAAVTVRRDPKPSDDSETGRWWDRLHEAIDAVEKEPSMSGQYEWKQLRKGFWQTIEDFTSNPFSKENISLGSWIYKEADVEDKLKAAQ